MFIKNCVEDCVESNFCKITKRVKVFAPPSNYNLMTITLCIETFHTTATTAISDKMATAMSAAAAVKCFFNFHLINGNFWSN